MYPYVESFVSLARRFVDEEPRVVVEAGAHDCADTLKFHALCPDANIFAFECNPDLFPICQHAVAGKPRIHLSNAGLSDADGGATFFKIVPESDDIGTLGSSSLLEFATDAIGRDHSGNRQQEAVHIRTTRLDTLMQAEHLPRIDLLWLDIQGAELTVLRGLGDRLRDVGVACLEVEFKRLYAGQPLYADVRRFMEARGFYFLELTAYHPPLTFCNAIFLNQQYVAMHWHYYLRRRIVSQLLWRVQNTVIDGTLSSLKRSRHFTRVWDKLRVPRSAFWRLTDDSRQK
jgi:FkbM family methyltransferase